MFVDTELLRCGAEFSRSGGGIVGRGAERFASVSLPVGIFGDFDSAHSFHSSLRRAHEAQVATMQGHRSELDALAEKSNAAASAFSRQDDAGGSALDSTVRDVG